MKTKLIIEFHGANYFGWQIQAAETKTVQGTLEKALKELYKVHVKTVGSGRTDAKVHSLNHHVLYTAPFDIPVAAIVKGLNSHLPPDIRVKSAELTTTDLNITAHAKSREYRYLFTNNSDANAFQTDLVANISFPLDLVLMKEALACFVGTHDFNDFHTKGSDPNTTVRTIFSAELLYIETNTHGIFPNHYCIKIVGSGFLKQMVRLIVACVWKAGRGKLSVHQIKDALSYPKGEHLAPVAPGVGLYKFLITY